MVMADSYAIRFRSSADFGSGRRKKIVRANQQACVKSDAEVVLGSFVYLLVFQRLDF